MKQVCITQSVYLCMQSTCSDADPVLSIAAIVAYLSSHVVLSVQPALGTDSEFSRQLHSLAAERIPGIISKEPEASCSMRIAEDDVLTPLQGPSITTQRGSSPIRFSAPQIRKASLNYDIFVHSVGLRPSLI